jgi:hypothetical protein
MILRGYPILILLMSDGTCLHVAGHVQTGVRAQESDQGTGKRATCESEGKASMSESESHHLSEGTTTSSGRQFFCYFIFFCFFVFFFLPLFFLTTDIQSLLPSPALERSEIRSRTTPV